MHSRRRRLVAVLLLSSGTAFAGTFTSTFNNPTQAGLNLTGQGTLSDGSTWTPVVANNSLMLTTNAGNLGGNLILDDLDSGKNIESFTATFGLKLGPGSSPPADGVAFAFGPDVTASSNFGEEGPGGPGDVVVEFDTYFNANQTPPDNIGIDVKVGGVEIATNGMAASDLVDSASHDVSIQLNRNGTLNVVWNSKVIYTNLYLPGWAPVNGEFGFGARTGGSSEECDLSNLKIRTTVAGAAAAATITGQPQAQTINESSNVTFSAVFDGTPPLTFQWFKNGTAIPDATNNVLTLMNVSASDTGAKYKVTISNAQGSVTSQEAVLTVNPDKTPPTVVSATGATDFTHATLVFSKPLDRTSAQTVGNYQISPSLTVSAASLSTNDNKTVTLTTSQQAENTTYTVTVTGVKDTAFTPNTVAANTKITFTSYGLKVVGATAFPGTTKIGIAFNLDLDPATAATAANYKVNGGPVTSAVVRTNVANELTNEKNLVQLTVASPLTNNFTVTIAGVKDFLGNALASTDVPGKILNLNITDIGSPANAPGGPDPLFPSTVTTWGPGAFDVLCNGNDYWNNADGFNFVWSPRTNSFDVKVRVVSVSPTDNWSAGAIEVRDAPPTAGDFANGHGWELSRHYFCKVDYGGPDPSLHGTGSGANAYEFNCRVAPGDPTVRETANTGPGESYGNWGGGTGPGNPGAPPYPNAWIRIARVQNGTNDHLIGYSSTNGVDWSQRMDADLNDTNHAGFLDLAGKPAGKWPSVCYVGLGSTSHTGVGNTPQTNDGSVGETWYSPIGQPFGCFVIYRDFGDVTPSAGPPASGIKLSFSVSGSNLMVSWTGTGKLQSKTDLNSSTWTDIGTTNPATVPIGKTGNLFLRVLGP